jgi:hypothetical protein
MPNWCNNDLHLTHDDPEMLQKAKDAWESGKFLATLVPEPDYTKEKVKHTFPMNISTGELKPEFVDPESAWWDWRIQNWGTKWDVGYDSALGNHVQGDEKEMFVYFDSAWSPPTSAYETLAELGFRIRAYYFEGGCAFCGSWIDGEDNYYDIKEYKADWVKKNIPSEIDEAMFISESMELDEEFE